MKGSCCIPIIMLRGMRKWPWVIDTSNRICLGEQNLSRATNPHLAQSGANVPTNGLEVLYNVLGYLEAFKAQHCFWQWLGQIESVNPVGDCRPTAGTSLEDMGRNNPS